MSLINISTLLCDHYQAPKHPILQTEFLYYETITFLCSYIPAPDTTILLFLYLVYVDSHNLCLWRMDQGMMYLLVDDVIIHFLSIYV